ncbi:uncharacterized protein G6M90_00g029420 [Metarhizium brunneum]|uniref:Uncharacterized protein n=1 Tax=Metarhizium brunneum TaxID=500148 RepID=A0A7D5UQ85_9HYPO|nr:hypothetical protein G6M90_00g029420 [Metarhizium brunneum]
MKVLLDADWGFRLEGVTYSKVKIRHGVRDRNMMCHFAGMMPSCTLYESNQDTHYTMGNDMEAALGELMGDPKAKNRSGMRLRTRGN